MYSFPEPFLPWSVIWVLLHVYSVSGDSNSPAGREGESSIREEACILICFFFSAGHLAIARLVKFGLSFRQCFLN